MYVTNHRMYTYPMATEVPVTRARERFSELVSAAASGPVFLTRHGRRQAVLLSAEEYERLMAAAEDAADIAAADDAMDALMAGATAIPWALVKADLGLE